MKSTGIVRRTDDLGRICIPKEIRKTLGIPIQGPLEIYVDGDKIVLMKHEENPSCSLCGYSDKPLKVIYPDKNVCVYCIEMIAKDQEKILKEPALV